MSNGVKSPLSETSENMSDEQMLRYARHIMLDEIGFEGQLKLAQSRVLILGLGGLGAPVAMYLAAAGVGRLLLLDDDTVELSNLQRQVIHTTQTIGMPKVSSAKQMLALLNPEVMVEEHPYRPNQEQIRDLVAQVDLVLDCSDNYRTRQVLNQTCFELKKPLVAAAAIRFDGQMSTYDARHDDSPCYACLFDPDDELGPDNCATLGVFSPLLGVMGSSQANEALKILLGIGQSLQGRLAMFNARTSTWTYLRISKNPHCKVCGANSNKVSAL